MVGRYAPLGLQKYLKTLLEIAAPVPARGSGNGPGRVTRCPGPRADPGGNKQGIATPFTVVNRKRARALLHAHVDHTAPTWGRSRPCADRPFSSQLNVTLVGSSPLQAVLAFDACRIHWHVVSKARSTLFCAHASDTSRLQGCVLMQSDNGAHADADVNVVVVVVRQANVGTGGEHFRMWSRAAETRSNAQVACSGACFSAQLGGPLTSQRSPQRLHFLLFIGLPICRRAHETGPPKPEKRSSPAHETWGVRPDLPMSPWGTGVHVFLDYRPVPRRHERAPMRGKNLRAVNAFGMHIRCACAFSSYFRRLGLDILPTRLRASGERGLGQQRAQYVARLGGVWGIIR